MSNSSPKPWHRGTLPGQRGYIFDTQEKAVVQAVNWGDIDLIAAAPDLLEALQVAQSYVEHADRQCIPGASMHLEQINAAIAKATGGDHG